MADLKAAGAVAIGDDAYPVADSAFMWRAMQWCKLVGLPFMAHCEDKSLTGDGVMNDGAVSSVLGLKGIPREAGKHRYGPATSKSRWRPAAICISCTSPRSKAWSLSASSKAREPRSPPKPARSTSPSQTKPAGATTPTPKCLLRSAPQLIKDAIIQGLIDGTIDTIGTDHAPHAEHEKEREFAVAPFGMNGLETALGLCVTHLVKPGYLTLSQLIEKLSCAPAKVINAPAGTLAIGSAADITVFDPEAQWQVDSSKFKSKSRNTVLQGATLYGKPQFTILAGRRVQL